MTKKNEIIFLGKDKNKEIDKGWYHQSFLKLMNDKKKINFVNGVEIINNGGVKVNIDYEKKKILILKQNIDSSIIFKGGLLSDWEIFFEDRSKEAPKFINDINGMTGCLNFIDITVKNLKLNARGSKCEDSINFIRVNGSVDNLNISASKSDGFDADFSKLKINNIKILNSGNDCVDFSYGEYELINAKLSGCGDKGVSIGEKSTVKLNKLIAENSNVGVATKDYGTLFAENLELENVKDCVIAYSKKQEFSGGKMNIKKINCSNFSNLFKSDKTSMIKIEENFSKKKKFSEGI